MDLSTGSNSTHSNLPGLSWLIQHFSLQDTDWPVLCHFLAILASALSVSRGVSTIEPVNRVIVPILLLIVVICFYWAIFLDFADQGIIHMFTPDWSEPALAAVSQYSHNQD